VKPPPRTQTDSRHVPPIQGFLTFACSGWCFVDIHPDSRISERDDNFLVVCHNAFSFEVQRMCLQPRNAWLYPVERSHSVGRE
jgi:hypothetical protein